MERKEDLPLLGFRRRKRAAAVCPAPAGVKAICRDRASKRWSALLTQTKSRIGHRCGMKKRLGEAHWAAFVKYAEAEHKEAFFRTLTPSSGMLHCAGRLTGAPCPKMVCINLQSLSATECGAALPSLHLDHTHDVKHVCKIWSEALPERPQTWDDGICGPLIAHLLFGTEDHVLAQCSNRPIWRKQIVFRCGNVRGVEGQHAEDFCHDLASAHYDFAHRKEDIQWPDSCVALCQRAEPPNAEGHQNV